MNTGKSWSKGTWPLKSAADEVAAGAGQKGRGVRKGKLAQKYEHEPLCQEPADSNSEIEETSRIFQSIINREFFLETKIIPINKSRRSQ
jgi:hypothetical protein